MGNVALFSEATLTLTQMHLFKSMPIHQRLPYASPAQASDGILYFLTFSGVISKSTINYLPMKLHINSARRSEKSHVVVKELHKEGLWRYNWQQVVPLRTILAIHQETVLCTLKPYRHLCCDGSLQNLKRDITSCEATFELNITIWGAPQQTDKRALETELEITTVVGEQSSRTVETEGEILKMRRVFFLSPTLHLRSRFSRKLLFLLQHTNRHVAARLIIRTYPDAE